MPEAKPAPTIETKQPATVNPPQTPAPIQKKQNEVPKEPLKVPPAPPTTMPPPPPKEVIPPKQSTEKGTAAEPKQAEAPKAAAPTEPKKPAGKKPEEKKPDEKAPATDPKPNAAPESKKPGERVEIPDELKPETTGHLRAKIANDLIDAEGKESKPATDPKKPDDKAPATDPKSKSTDVPKKEELKAPITANGAGKVEKPKEPLKPVPTGKPTAEPAKDPPKSADKTPPSWCGSPAPISVLSPCWSHRMTPCPFTLTFE